VKAGAAAHVGDQPGHGGLAVGAGHCDRRHPRRRQRRGRAGVDVAQGGPGRLDPLGQVGPRRLGGEGGDGPPERLGGMQPPPRVGDHHLARLGTRPAPHRRRPHPGRCRGPADQVGQQPGREPAPLLAAGGPDRAAGRPTGVAGAAPPDPPGQPGAVADGGGLRLGEPEQAGDVEGELDRGTREVQVGSVEDAKLDQRFLGTRRGGRHGRTVVQPVLPPPCRAAKVRP
jgi:hypothetical protein